MIGQGRIGVWGTVDGVEQWLSTTEVVGIRVCDRGDRIAVYNDRDLSLTIVKNGFNAVLKIENVEDPSLWMTMPIDDHIAFGTRLEFGRDKS